MSGTASRDRLQPLEKIELNIISAMQCAGQALQELSKDKPAHKYAEQHTSTFIKTLQEVENAMTAQIRYLAQVSTGQPHEGSCYSATKELQMAMHRQEHVKSRLQELEAFKVEHLQKNQQHPHGSSLHQYSHDEQS